MAAPPTMASEVLVQNINRTSTYFYCIPPVYIRALHFVTKSKIVSKTACSSSGSPRPMLPFRTEEDDKVPSLPKVRLPLSPHPTHLLSLTVVHSADVIHYFVNATVVTSN